MCWTISSTSGFGQDCVQTEKSGRVNVLGSDCVFVNAYSGECIRRTTQRGGIRRRCSGYRGVLGTVTGLKHTVFGPVGQLFTCFSELGGWFTRVVGSVSSLDQIILERGVVALVLPPGEMEVFRGVWPVRPWNTGARSRVCTTSDWASSTAKSLGSAF